MATKMQAMALAAQQPQAAPDPNAPITTATDPAQVLPFSNAPEPPAPPKLDQDTLDILGRMYQGVFDRYRSERLPVEQRWLRNLRQVMGVYDPQIETVLPPNRSRAYPRLTRTKCASMLSRVMNIMFPGNEKNWSITASPSPAMDPHEVAEAVSQLIAQMQAAGLDTTLTQELVDTAVKKLADDQAEKLSTVIEGQLDDIGEHGHKLDWISLNRKVVDSGIKYGIGIVEGPYVHEEEIVGWTLTAPVDSPVSGQSPGGFQPVSTTVYKPGFEFLPVWDFYPDMTARSLPGEGYFVRKILSSHKLKKMRDRPDFIAGQITKLLQSQPNGNYNTLWWETELRAMGTAINSDRNSNATSSRHRYEVMVWRGPVEADMLQKVGVDIDDEAMEHDLYAEMWVCAGVVIKVDLDPWRRLGENIHQVHVFSFDEDDTSPIGQGLPYAMRDSQLSICAATRMALDNASVCCGPNVEINRRLLDPSMDQSAIQPYKVWVRDDDDPQTVGFPAVREIKFDSHLQELTTLISMFERFADSETFVGAATGGDLENMPSEPMRTASGASMINGNLALPFKDVVRNFDVFTQSVLISLIAFNRAFNPENTPEGDYSPVARGATSLVAKEVRGNAIDSLAQTLTDEERQHIDPRKFIKARLASRDLDDLLRPEHEVEMEQAQQAQAAQAQQAMQQKMQEAQIGVAQADQYKAATQGQKNAATAQHTQVKAATDLIQAGAPDAAEAGDGGDGGAAAGSAATAGPGGANGAQTPGGFA